MKIKNFAIELLRTLHKNGIITSKIFITIISFIIFKKLLNWKDINLNLRLNEKLQVYKLTINNHPLVNIIADKLAIRSYVNKKVDINFTKIIFKTNQLTNFNFNSLKVPLVIKTNHGSGMYDIIKKPEIVNWTDKISTYIQWTSKNFYYVWAESQYKKISPFLYGEELLENDDSDIIDYKFHCFNGKVEFIHIASDRMRETKRNFFDIDWNEMNMYWGPIDKFQNRTRARNLNLKRPNLLNEMVNIARTLSSDFDYVRVDLMICREKIYFGELTLHPGSGFEFFQPESLDFYYGSKLRLN